MKWWRGKDLNLRTRKRADLQSAAIDHSATPPVDSCAGEVKAAATICLPPAVYHLNSRLPKEAP